MRNKFYIKYIRNYIAIVGVSILLLIPIYISIYREAEERISDSAYNNLNEIISSMDRYLERISVSADVFHENEYMRSS